MHLSAAVASTTTSQHLQQPCCSYCTSSSITSNQDWLLVLPIALGPVWPAVCRRFPEAVLLRQHHLQQGSWLIAGSPSVFAAAAGAGIPLCTDVMDSPFEEAPSTHSSACSSQLLRQCVMISCT